MPGCERKSWDNNVDTAGRKEDGENSFGSSDHVVLVEERKQAPFSLRLADVACRLGMLSTCADSSTSYAVDSLILLIQSIIATYAVYEFEPSFTNGLTIAVYTGMLIGALFWGLTADIIGRKYAFNVSLLLSSIFAIVAGASPNWIVLGLFTCLSAFGAGGNLVLDTAVFLEYLPSKDQWLLTLMAAWWGVGQLVAGLFAWAFLPNFSCEGPESETGEPCNWNTNPGWRYVWFANGALVFAMSISRITVIRLRETPKFLVGEGRDADVVETLQWIAKTYNRTCSLTLERMQACGVTDVHSGRRGSVSAHGKSKFSFSELGSHFKGLFATRRMGLSTSLIWFSWVSFHQGRFCFNAASHTS